MRFLAEPERPPPPERPDRAVWRWLLLGAAAVAAIATAQPWIRVAAAALFAPFQDVFGPPAWRSSAGFTCLSTAALVTVLTLAETGTRTSIQAVRPASLVVVAVMAATVALHAGQGPGMLRGLTAIWTPSFYVGTAAVAVLVACCALRYQATGRRDREPRRRDSITG